MKVSLSSNPSLVYAFHLHAPTTGLGAQQAFRGAEQPISCEYATKKSIYWGCSAEKQPEQNNPFHIFNLCLFHFLFHFFVVSWLVCFGGHLVGVFVVVIGWLIVFANNQFIPYYLSHQFNTHKFLSFESQMVRHTSAPKVNRTSMELLA